MIDLAIRAAEVYDGSGRASFVGDVGVDHGRIVAVGEVSESARVELTAKDLAVAPGFIDVHTHFDAQLSWDGYAKPILEHGVTTIVTGNCSLSLAPLREVNRDRMCRMFREIEEMPPSTFDHGIRWEWQSFDQWIATVSGELGVNVAPLVGHTALRMWVMGDDCARPATGDEIKTISGVLRDALAAGASGVSTSFIDLDELGHPVPSRYAADDELDALAATLGAAGHGILQVAHEYFKTARTLERVDQLGRLSIDHGIPATFSPLFASPQTPDMVPRVLERLSSWTDRGAQIWPQVQTRPIDINFRLCERNFILRNLPTWDELSRLPSTATKLAAIEDHSVRASLIAEAYPDGDDAKARATRRRIESAYVARAALEENRHLVGRTLGELGYERGTNAAEAMIHVSESELLETTFRIDEVGHADVRAVGELLTAPQILIGASDAGAHMQAFATYGDTCYLFSKFVREAHVLSTEAAVRRLTYDPALAWGLRDRGLLAPGRAADLVVFDPAAIDRTDESLVADLPGGGERYIRRSTGVHTVIVNGAVAWTAADGYSAPGSGAIASTGRR